MSAREEFEKWWAERHAGDQNEAAKKLAFRAWQAARQGGEVEPVADDEKGSLPWFVEVYNHGYQAGHNDTVEGYFTDVHHTDLQAYHEDEVMELLEGLNVEASKNHPPAPAQSEPDWLNRLNSCEFHDDDREACAKYSGQVPCSSAPTQGVTNEDLWEVLREAVASMPLGIAEDDNDTPTEHIYHAIKPFIAPNHLGGECRWQKDPGGVWTGACGKEFWFDDGGPSDNGMKYCLSCGRSCVEIGGDDAGVADGHDSAM